MLLKNASTQKRIVFTIIYAVIVALLICAPLFLSDFRLNLLGKFLAFAIVALGLDLIWGYTGILSLGHGIFFGIGAYCMAMYLKLTAAGGDALPDFMQWSGVESLPWFWEPFRYFGLALLLSVLLPMLLALFLGFFTFRNRIRGVYFTILTQALVLIVVTLMIGQQAYTGGTNGLTGFTKVLGFSLGSPDVKLALYFVTVAVLIGSFLLCRWLVRGQFGKVLQAVRDGENRLRFLGYDPSKYQMFVFTISAGLAGLAGVMFVLQVGIISPSMMDIVPSIEMVLWVAIGGRGSLIGAAAGALLINASKSVFSETYPDFWTFLLGALFIIVVVFLPKGLFGLVSRFGQRMKGGLEHVWFKGRSRSIVRRDYH
ncbi:urea ABC transporter permease subunit UrtC [Paenibacillus sp. SN-8-1]|uniref:urea ABC transporter permease subunit UrtC n=1 Tax=Paenibacillus sp. SN-8-1 TaxID=3435409 RepID=UPI003D9A26EE